MDSEEDFQHGSSGNGDGGVIAGKFPSDLSGGIIPPPPTPAWAFVTDDDDAAPSPQDIDLEAVQSLLSTASKAA